MKLAAATLLIYTVLILGGGFVAYFSGESIFPLVSAVVLSVVLISLAYRAFIGSVPAGYLGGVLTLLLAIYFAYRFIATERLVPNGVLLIISFIALFGVTLGVFLGLQRRL